MKNLIVAFTTLLVALSTSASFAQTAPLPPSTQVAASPAEMTEGDVRKVDKEAKKITIKHGEIKSLDMPGMTMVFQVKDAALLETVKVGDKVRFVAEKSGGALVVTAIQPAK